MAIDSKNLLVWVKAMSRGQALPLDASEIYESLAEAETYATTSAIAYAGQTIKAKAEDGKYHEYIIQPSETGYVLEEVSAGGTVDESKLKRYVQVVSTLPESGQSEGVLYICDTDGYVWTGSDWKSVFQCPSADMEPLKAYITEYLNTRLGDIPEDTTIKAYIDAAIGSGGTTGPDITIDYDSYLAFDTSEIVFDKIDTTSVLGVAILGQMVLA